MGLVFKLLFVSYHLELLGLMLCVYFNLLWNYVNPLCMMFLFMKLKNILCEGFDGVCV